MSRKPHIPVCLLCCLAVNHGYSGYIRQELPQGALLLANTLSTPANTVAEVFQYFPVMQFPNNPYETNANGVSILKITPSGFVACNYLNGWSEPSLTLKRGESWFFSNPRPKSFLVTFVGDASDGTNSLPGGLCACANVVPAGGLLSSSMGFPILNGEQVFLFNNTDSSYETYSYTGAWSPNEPSLNVNQAFWANKMSATNWVRDDGLGGTANFLTEVVTSAVAQLNFFTYNITANKGCVFYPDGSTAVSDDYSGQLYASLTPSEASLQAVGAAAKFEGGSGAGFIRSGTVPIPFAIGGQTVYAQLRVWSGAYGSTFEEAVQNGAAQGKSELMTLTGHATVEGGLPGLPPPSANTYSSFSITPATRPCLRIKTGDSGTFIDGEGPANRIHLIQVTEGMNPSYWWTGSTNLSDVNGRFSWADTNAAALNTRLYRAYCQ